MHALIELEQKLRLRQRQLPTFISRSFIVLSSCFPLFYSKAKYGWTKSDEKLQEQYSSVIKQLKKGYPIRLVAKSEGVGVSTVQRMKKKFVDNVA